MIDSDFMISVIESIANFWGSIMELDGFNGSAPERLKNWILTAQATTCCVMISKQHYNDGK